MAAKLITTRPSAAALARKASYPDLGSQSKDTINKPSCAGEDARFPTAYPHASRVPTPHPFVAPQVSRWDSDVSMRDTSSGASSLSCQQLAELKTSPVHIPLVETNVKSRKEGMHPPAGLSPGSDTCHGQDIPPRVDKQFVPGHKGMSSMDSTGRLERQLFSALGEELNSFSENIDPASASRLEDLGDSPVAKRKRQGTFGAERDRSPIAKMVREGSVRAQGAQKADTSHLQDGN